MRKKALIRLAGVLLAVLGVVALVMVWQSWEPWCGLTPVGYWLDRYGASPGDYKPCPKADATIDSPEVAIENYGDLSDNPGNAVLEFTYYLNPDPNSRNMEFGRNLLAKERGLPENLPP
jgi:hypothetical protein